MCLSFQTNRFSWILPCILSVITCDIGGASEAGWLHGKKTGNMETFERCIALGKEHGLGGKELLDFVREREERRTAH